MPFRPVISDATREGDFSFALGGGYPRAEERRPRVSIIDETAASRWHERPPQDRDLVLWFKWDLRQKRTLWGCWPVDVWPEAAVGLLSQQPELLAHFLRWVVGKAGVDREELSRALRGDGRLVVREVGEWMARFLAETSPALAQQWDLLWFPRDLWAAIELVSEAGDLEAVGLQLDSARDPALQRGLLKRLVFCILALAREHPLAKVLAETYPEAKGRPVVLAWCGVVAPEASVDRFQLCLDSLRKADQLYLKARDVAGRGEELAAELEGFAHSMWRYPGLRGVESTLFQRGDREQITDIERSGVAAGWEAVSKRYDIFRLETSLRKYVRHAMEREMGRCRVLERRREEHQVSLYREVVNTSTGEADLLDVTQAAREDIEFERAEQSASLRNVLMRVPLTRVGAETLAAYDALRRKYPGARHSELCRLLAQQAAVPEETMRKRLYRARRRLDGKT